MNCHSFKIKKHILPQTLKVQP